MELIFKIFHKIIVKSERTRCTQREQNTQLDVISLTSVIKYCTGNNKIKLNMYISIFSGFLPTEKNMAT